MFRLIERDDGSTAVIERSSGSLVSVVPKRDRSRSTSSTNKRQNHDPRDGTNQSDLKRIKKDGDEGCPRSLLLLNNINNNDNNNSVISNNIPPTTNHCQEDQLQQRPSSPASLLISTLPLVDCHDENNLTLGSLGTLGRHEEASESSDYTNDNSGSTSTTRRRSLRPRNTQTDYNEEKRFQSLIPKTEFPDIVDDNGDVVHHVHTSCDDEDLISDPEFPINLSGHQLSPRRRSLLGNYSRNGSLVNDFNGQPRNGRFGHSLLQNGGRSRRCINRMKNKKVDHHYVIVYKTSNDNVPCPSRLRRLPMVTLNKLKSELSDTMKRIQTNDVIVNQQQSTQQVQRLSKVGQHQVIQMFNKTITTPLAGQSLLATVRNSLKQQPLLPLLPILSSTPKVSTTTTQSINNQNVGAKEAEVVKDDASSATSPEVASFFKHLNLIPSNTLKKVPLSDLNNTWPLRLHCRSSPTMKSKAYNLMMTPPFMKTKSNLITRSNGPKSNSNGTNGQGQRSSLLGIGQRTTNSVYKTIPGRNLGTGHFGSHHRQFKKTGGNFERVNNFRNGTLNRRAAWSSRRSSLNVSNGHQNKRMSLLTPKEREQIESKELWIKKIKSREPFVSLQSVPQMVVSFDSTTPVVGVKGQGQHQGHLVMKRSLTREQLFEQQMRKQHELMMKTAIESKEENKILINKFIKKFMFDQINIEKKPIEVASPLGRRFLKNNYFLQFNNDNYLLMVRLIRIRDRNCSTNPYYNKYLLNNSLYSTPTYKIDLNDFDALIKPNNLSVRTLRSLATINPMSWCWGIKTYHLYTFNKQERLEKDLTLKTRLDWKSRLLINNETKTPPTVTSTITNEDVAVSIVSNISSSPPSSSSAAASPPSVASSMAALTSVSSLEPLTSTSSEVSVSKVAANKVVKDVVKEDVRVISAFDEEASTPTIPTIIKKVETPIVASTDQVQINNNNSKSSSKTVASTSKSTPTRLSPISLRTPTRSSSAASSVSLRTSSSNKTPNSTLNVTKSTPTTLTVSRTPINKTSPVKTPIVTKPTIKSASASSVGQSLLAPRVPMTRASLRSASLSSGGQVVGTRGGHSVVKGIKSGHQQVVQAAKVELIL